MIFWQYIFWTVLAVGIVSLLVDLAVSNLDGPDGPSGWV